MYCTNKPAVVVAEEDDNEDDGGIATMIEDQFCSVRPPRERRNHNSSNNNICSNIHSIDETDPTKYQTTNRSASLPARQTFPSNKSTEDSVEERRRYASGSNNHNNNNKTKTTSLVTSFLQYLRSELKATTNENINDYQRIRQKKSSETIDCISQTFYLTNNSRRQSNRNRMSSLSASSSSSSSLTPSSPSMPISLNKLSNENLLKNTFDNDHTADDNEILTLINLLILRVECLNNDSTVANVTNTKTKSSTIRKIDQNLIEYLYFLFNKFVEDESDSSTPSIINKTRFVNVCQTLVRDGSLNISLSFSSPDHSCSESTITNNSDQTLMQTLVREYRPDADLMTANHSPINNEQISSITMNDDDTWLIVDLEQIKPQDSKPSSDALKCLLLSTTSDDQLLPANENYFSVDEVKSCESESSHSNYYSPDSSLVDTENMPQEADETNNINNNNNNTAVFDQEGSSSSTEYTSNNTNVIKEAKDTTSNSNICTGLTHDCTTNSNEQVASASSIDTVEQMTTSSSEKMSRRERKMQERWTTTTKVNKTCQEQLPTKSFLGVEFPPIAVLRRKFSSSPPSKSNTLPIKKKDNSSSKTKTSMKKEDKNNSSQDNISKSNGYISLTPLNRSMSLQNQEINTSITTDIVDQTKNEHQVLDDLQSNDTSSILICYDGKTNDDAQQSSKIILDLLRDVKSLQEDMKIKTKQDLTEYENEIFTPTNNDSDHYEQMNINNNNNNNNNNSRTINDSCDSHSPSSSLLLKSSSLLTNADDDKTIELLPTEILAVVVKEEEEEEKKEEEHCDDDNDDNVRVEKKNQCDVEHNNHHALGTILINDESTQPVLLEQEKKENEEEQEKERPLPTLEQCNHQQFEDESFVKILSNNLENKLIMSKNIDDDHEERYKTIEIEEIPDEDDELSEVNNRSIEPIDCILTDDELQQVPRQTSTKPAIVPTDDKIFFHDTVISSYQKAMLKIIDTVDDPMKPSNSSSKDSQSPLVTTSAQRPEDDPIALRALKRFEQSMNAAMATKGGNDDVNASIAKGKSSWSGTLSAPRKSLDNVFKHDQSNSSVTDEQSTTKIASPLISPRDAFIRPRKTILDDIGINLGLSRNLFGMVQNNSTNDENHKIEEQQMPIAILENNVQQGQYMPNSCLQSVLKLLEMSIHLHFRINMS
ncbi:unnamed protein product [Rotaria socialis]|uniref:Uncharacterized protein n=1 Tax=Rotaria socialis TaxID=392032 RepID=A0A820CC37_9BILA|nr:unnamed protein product [Rotaria socialis]